MLFRSTHVHAVLARARARLDHSRTRYGLREWPRQLVEQRDGIELARKRLTLAVVDGMHARRTRVSGFADRLRALSPRLVMERGYCLVRRPDGTLLKIASELVLGDRLTVEFARGEADARVDAVRPGEEHGH